MSIGVAIYYGMQGEKLTDGPVDFWLDRCWWGKHQGLKGLKLFANAEEELQHYFELLYTPQIVSAQNKHLLSKKQWVCY